MKVTIHVGFCKIWYVNVKYGVFVVRLPKKVDVLLTYTEKRFEICLINENLICNAYL